MTSDTFLSMDLDILNFMVRLRDIRNAPRDIVGLGSPNMKTEGSNLTSAVRLG